MGIIIECDEIHYRCGYGNWNNIRLEIFRASIKYLEKQIEVIKNCEENDDEAQKEDDIECINNLLSTIRNNNYNSIPQYLDMFFSSMEFVNVMVRHGLSGVFALINKGDDAGYYSVGNSMDILISVNLLKNEIQKTFQKSVEQVCTVFDESITKKKIVSIY